MAVDALSHHLDELLEERRAALRTPLAHNEAYMADLDAEIATWRRAVVIGEVTALAVARSVAHGKLSGWVPPFQHTLRIRYQECDAQGVVYFARYPEYYDIALTEMFRAAIGSYGAMVDSGIDMVVAEQSLRYRSPARFDELVDVELVIDRLGETSMASSYVVSRDGETLVEGDMRHVFIEVATKAKTPIPGAIREALAGYCR